MTSAPHSLNSEPIYTFRYTIFDVIVQLKRDHLIAKMGMKTHVIPIEEITFLYKRHIKQQGVLELTIAFYRDGKTKRARLYSDLNQEDFESLWSELLWRRPESDISNLSLREAFEKMGSRDLPWVVIPSLMASAVLLLAVIGAPLLIHGLDNGHWPIEIDQVYERPSLLDTPESYNVQIAGRLDLEHSLMITEGKGEEIQNHLIVPLYPRTRTQDKVNQQALIALSLRGRGLGYLDTLKHGEAVDGILRNIWWEGLGHQSRRALIERGATLSPKISLIEVGVKRRDDLQIYLLFISLLSGVTLLVAAYLKPYSIKDQSR